MKVILCARLFPVFHPKAGTPTGFKEKILAGTKIHTLRQTAGNRKTGDIISLREWTGRPYASKQQEFARTQIVVSPITFDWSLDPDPIMSLFAKNDGFDDPLDFALWFTNGNVRPVHFNGVCINFTDVTPITSEEQ